MNAVKMNFSFDPQIAEIIRSRAQEQGKPQSHYLAELVAADARAAREALAAEGYRSLAADTLDFARDAMANASVAWPGWED